MIKGLYYWRVTITNATGTTISPVRKLTIEAPIKRVLYQVENITKYVAWTSKRAYYQFENVTKYVAWTKTRTFYQYENITEDHPYPTIFRLSSYRANKGGSITIYGSGFGSKPDDDTANADRSLRSYGGIVYVGTKTCSVLSWSWNEIKVALPSDAVSGAVKVVLTKPDTSGNRESNLFGLEVLNIIEEVETGLELYICEKDAPNVVTAQIISAKDKSFQELLNAAGAGQFSINTFAMTEAERAGVNNGNYVLCRIDGFDYFKWVIENIKPTVIDVGERGAEKLDVSGRGILSILKSAIVYPTTTTNPQTLERGFTGVTAAGILITFLEEAQARGAISHVTWDFTADADSFGMPWTDSFDFNFHSGTDLMQVAEKFTNGLGIFDLHMEPNLKLTARIKNNTSFGKGTDVSEKIIFRPGQALLKLSSFYNSPEIINSALVEGKDGTVIEVSDEESMKIYGRKEGYLQSKDTAGTSLSAYGNAMMMNKSKIDWGHEADVSFQYFKINKDFFLGDYIKIFVPDHGNGTEISSKVRVKGYTISADNDTNALHISLNLNNLLLEKIISIDQLQQRLAQSSADVSLTSTDSEPKVSKSTFEEHSHKHGLLQGLGDDDHTQYFNAERHTADSHSGITRVNSIKKQGSSEMTGAVTLMPGANIALTQDDTNKTITISSAGGGGGSNYLYAIDAPPSTPHAKDDEFIAASLDAKWSYMNQGAMTATIVGGRLVLDIPSGVDPTRGILQTAPAGDFTIIAKINTNVQEVNYSGFGICFYNSANSRVLYAGKGARSGARSITMVRTTTAAWNSDIYLQHGIGGVDLYIKATKIGTTITYYFSTDGTCWVQIGSETISTWLLAVTHIGLAFYRNNSTAGMKMFGICDWFRVTEP